MKKISIILVIVSFIMTSCDLIPGLETNEETSFTMEYNGVTYTEVEPLSLTLVDGEIFVLGSEEKQFLLSISGVGEDGTTMDICNGSDCENECVLMLTLGDSDTEQVEDLFTATSGTIKRTGNKIEIDVSGTNILLETNTLTATIELGTTLDL